MTAYNKRRLAEIAISALKQMFGESLMPLKWDSMAQEAKLRIALCSKRIGEAAAMQ